MAKLLLAKLDQQFGLVGLGDIPPLIITSFLIILIMTLPCTAVMGLEAFYFLPGFKSNTALVSLLMFLAIKCYPKT